MEFKKYNVPYENFNIKFDLNDILVLTQNEDINWEWDVAKSFCKITKGYNKINNFEFKGDFLNHTFKIYLDCNNIYNSYICYKKKYITVPCFVPEELIEGYIFLVFNFKRNIPLTNYYLNFLDDFLWLLNININNLKLTFVED